MGGVMRLTISLAVIMMEARMIRSKFRFVVRIYV